jgi:hypothetical protein
MCQRAAGPIGLLYEMNKSCEVVHVNSYDVHTRLPKAPLQGCVRLASIAVGVHRSFSFRFENLNDSQVFRFLQVRSLQNIAHKFSYDLCMQYLCLPMSSRCASFCQCNLERWCSRAPS